MVKRSGGREARKAVRAAPLAEHLKPVQAGESGGQYKPLTSSDVEAIRDTCYRILEDVGFADATPHCIETCTAIGAVMGDDGRLRMPREVVDHALSLAARNITLHGQDPKHDVLLSGSRVHFATAGAAVLIADSVKREYRESQAQDGPHRPGHAANAAGTTQIVGKESGVPVRRDRCGCSVGGRRVLFR